VPPPHATRCGPPSLSDYGTALWRHKAIVSIVATVDPLWFAFDMTEQHCALAKHFATTRS
jgi:hypothetical protein